MHTLFNIFPSVIKHSLPFKIVVPNLSGLCWICKTCMEDFNISAKENKKVRNHCCHESSNIICNSFPKVGN